MSPFLKASFTHLRMRACTHTPRERASERGEREREREREWERKGERARESARILFQVRPAHHIVSARQAYAHLPCFLRPGYPLPPRPVKLREGLMISGFYWYTAGGHLEGGLYLYLCTRLLLSKFSEDQFMHTQKTVV